MPTPAYNRRYIVRGYFSRRESVLSESIRGFLCNIQDHRDTVCVPEPVAAFDLPWLAKYYGFGWSAGSVASGQARGDSKAAAAFSSLLICRLKILPLKTAILHVMENRGEVILYQPDNEIKLEVRLEDETVWLNRQQLSELFNRDVKTIGKHINNALKEELAGIATVANFATVQKEGDRTVTRHVEYYNLDMILSVGYRVKSSRGIEFRRWANSVLKEYLLKGHSVNRRLTELEHTVAEHSRKIDFFVRTSLPPVEGVFHDGQIFDAYKFVTDLIRSAKKSILLIDNYIDESVLLMLSKRNADVKADICTQTVSHRLQLDLQKHNSQYPPISIHTCRKCHDRFLIIDSEEVWHIGASLKDLGKKIFAFSRLNIPAEAVTDLH